MGKNEKAASSGPSLVLPPSIYIGPRAATSSQSFLSAKAITHVLSHPAKEVDGIIYHCVSLNDAPSSSITKPCDSACTFLDAALKSKNARILVHCSAGMSRSPTVVTAYLMKRQGMTLKAALGQIVRVRPQTSPNRGFLGQLKEMEMELFGSVSLDVDEIPSRREDRLALFEADNLAVPEDEG